MSEMPERTGGRAANSRTQPAMQAGQAPLPASNLGLCPDCHQLISHQAESCPHCGRFIQRFGTKMVIDRKGWVSTIAWGILLAAVLPWLLLIALAFLVLIGGVGGRSLIR